MITTIW